MRSAVKNFFMSFPTSVYFEGASCMILPELMEFETGEIVFHYRFSGLA